MTRSHAKHLELTHFSTSEAQFPVLLISRHFASPFAFIMKKSSPVQIQLKLGHYRPHQSEGSLGTLRPLFVSGFFFFPFLFPGAWLGSMYEGRWIVEPDFGSIKCTLGLEHLRGQSPESLHRELWIGVLTYNLMRLKMLQSGYAADREIRSMSFTETHQLLATNWLLCAFVGVSEAMAVSAQQQGTCAVIGQRPDRVEPRENKRRPKVLKLMTVARRMFHAALAAITKIP